MNLCLIPTNEWLGMSFCLVVGVVLGMYLERFRLELKDRRTNVHD